jgi:predicted regulator of Ras-like GTPase activity (Roadblock/LC7/MglB family)
MVATTDGLLVTHDIPDLEPDHIAALIATTLGLARQATQTTGRGEFREAVVRGGDGYLAVYAVGDESVMAVLGTNDLNVGMLLYQARDLINRIMNHLSDVKQTRHGHGLPGGSFGVAGHRGPIRPSA